MKKEKFRKFLPSIITMDFTHYDAYHIETGFLSDNLMSTVKVELVTDLSPGGINYGLLVITNPDRDCVKKYSARIPAEDAQNLLNTCSNKIKKYQYKLTFNETDVYINRYTLGVVTIDLDNSKHLDILPEYCGKEITDDLSYNELYLSGMRETLRKERKKK